MAKNILNSVVFHATKLKLGLKQQQYRVAPCPTGSAGPGFGFWLTGKLGGAWVVHGSVHGAGWVGGGVVYLYWVFLTL